MFKWLKKFFFQEDEFLYNSNENFDDPEYRVIKISQPTLNMVDCVGSIEQGIKYLIEKKKPNTYNEWEVVWNSSLGDQNWTDEKVYEKAQNMLKNELKLKKSVEVMNVSLNGPCIPVKISNNKEKIINIMNRKMKERWKNNENI